MTKEISERHIKEYGVDDRYENGKNKQLKVAFQSNNSVEEIVRIEKKLGEIKEHKEVRIKRCLSQEDKEVVKERIEESKRKNGKTSEEEEMHFLLGICSTYK